MSFEQLDLFETCQEEEEFDELENSNLTDRQKKTYNYIKMCSMLNRSARIKDIVDNYSADRYDDGYVWNSNPKVHNPCASVWSDVNKINANKDISKIIIWNDNYEYKFASNQKEVEEFCKTLYWERAMAKLWRHGNLMRKVARDGQYNLFKDRDDAREFWQTFLNSHVDDLVEKSLKEAVDEKDTDEE